MSKDHAVHDQNSVPNCHFSNEGFNEALFIDIPFLGTDFWYDHNNKRISRLISFFVSEEFKTHSSGCDIVLHEEGLDHGIAELRMEATKKGMINLIRLNAHCVDKKVFSAEELKFIICHELGHFNDKGMLKRFVLSEVIVLQAVLQY